MLRRFWSIRLADRMTVRQQTAAMTGLLCIATVCVVSIGAALLARRDAVRDANLALAAMAQTMADRLDQNMFERYREIKNIANLEPLRAVWQSDPAKIRGILAPLQSTLEDYTWLGFATPDGIVRAASRGMLEGASVAQRPWFLNGSRGPAVEDVHDAKLLDQLLRRSPDEAPFRFVDVAMPIIGQKGALAGVLGAHLSWNWASEVRSSVLLKHGAELESDIRVHGRDGNPLLGPNGAAALSATVLADLQGSGTVVFEDRSGSRPLLTALVATKGQSDYPGLGWIVAASRPIDVALGPANRLTLVIGALGLAIAAIGAGSAWLLAGTVTGPLTRLCRSIDLIGRDPAANGVPHQHGSRDILRLSAAMRSLLRRLGTAEQHVREAQEAIREVEHRAEEQARLADEKTRRLGSDIHTLRALADTDPLTGLFNRRAFLPFAEDAMNYFKRYRRDVGILMFDIDHFKRVNDTFGHAAGDEVIRAVGKVIGGQIRSTDKAARFGGEEFVVLLRETDEAGAKLLANRIREAVENLIMTQGLTQLSITTSVGAALADRSDRDIEDVIARADAALYVAKSGGRNRVVMAEQEALVTQAA